jgi:quinol monooxygenase YgiN
LPVCLDARQGVATFSEISFGKPSNKNNATMLVIQIQIQVKPEFIDAFKQATLANARESIKEPGIARFDILQQQDDPARFVFVEVYRTPEANAAHKETRHYQTWRDVVAPMMAAPRSPTKLTNIFPEDKGW